jgi:hypothetical protein
MKSRIRISLFVFAALMCLTLVLAQSQPLSTSVSAQDNTNAQTADVLTNNDVVGMLKAGWSAEIIIAKIKSSQSKFDTSLAALEELKAANVPLSLFDVGGSFLTLPTFNFTVWKTNSCFYLYNCPT